MGFHLPDTFVVTLSSTKRIQFHKNTSTQTLAGLSEKGIYYDIQDKENTPFFVKISKERSQEAILPANIAPALYKTKKTYTTFQKVFSTFEEELQTIANQYKKLQKQYDKHRATLLETHLFLEALSPRIAQKIFGDFLIVPENYFFRLAAADGSDPIPVILSKGVPNFREFLSESPIVKDKKTVKDWDNTALPEREDFKPLLSIEHAKALGKLYYAALLMGHHDLLNNIDLSNSGVRAYQGQVTPVIVDWGNAMGSGFGGLSIEESAFRNPDINPEANKNIPDLIGFKHCVPFDILVYPLLPRQLVGNLFELGSNSDISKAMLEGFEEAHHIAYQQLNNLDTLIPTAIESTLTQYTAEPDQELMRANLMENKLFYFPKDHNQKTYTLVNVMQGRIRSLGEILAQLQQGKNIKDIAEERLKEIIAIQNKYQRSKVTEENSKQYRQYHAKATPTYFQPALGSSVDDSQPPLAQEF